MKKIVLSKKLIFIAIISVLTAAACDNTLDVFTKKIKIPQYYGNGVYYFDCNGKEFAESLSIFLENGKEVSAITNIGTPGSKEGYLVVVKNNNEKILNNHLIAN